MIFLRPITRNQEIRVGLFSNDASKVKKEGITDEIINGNKYRIQGQEEYSRRVAFSTFSSA
jgi:hypothetical protein